MGNQKPGATWDVVGRRAGGDGQRDRLAAWPAVGCKSLALSSIRSIAYPSAPATAGRGSSARRTSSILSTCRSSGVPYELWAELERETARTLLRPDWRADARAVRTPTVFGGALRCRARSTGCRTRCWRRPRCAARFPGLSAQRRHGSGVRAPRRAALHRGVPAPRCSDAARERGAVLRQERRPVARLGARTAPASTVTTAAGSCRGRPRRAVRGTVAAAAGRRPRPAAARRSDSSRTGSSPAARAARLRRRPLPGDDLGARAGPRVLHDPRSGRPRLQGRHPPRRRARRSRHRATGTRRRRTRRHVACAARPLHAGRERTACATRACASTRTRPTSHFVLDRHPATGHGVIVASPCSGHGFKFATAIGEALADLVTGRRRRVSTCPRFALARLL